MRATLTILWDSLQLLRARKLFWVVVVITILVAVVYASVGFQEDGITFLFGLMKMRNAVVGDEDIAKMTYFLMFSDLIAPFWLGFFAVLLGLLASCSVYPEMMREGSVETFLSKPVSRWRLYLVKYLGMLGFMAVPILIFALIVFFAFGMRFGVWKPELFIAVPLMTFVYGILYSFAVMIGTWSRSTLLSLLGALLLWTVCFGIHFFEWLFYAIGIQAPNSGLDQDFQTGATEQTEERVEPDEGFVGFYQVYTKATTLLPKPRKSALLLKQLVVFEDLKEFEGISLLGVLIAGELAPELHREANAEATNRMSPQEILIPSAVFQVVMLGIGGWIFVRKDF